MMWFFWGYLGAVCLAALALCGVDKWKAKNGRWRISEKVLLLTAGLGGAWGLLMGMVLFNHKTKHWSFRILTPLFSLLWIGAAIALVIWAPLG